MFSLCTNYVRKTLFLKHLKHIYDIPVLIFIGIDWMTCTLIGMGGPSAAIAMRAAAIEGLKVNQITSNCLHEQSAMISIL